MSPEHPNANPSKSPPPALVKRRIKGFLISGMTSLPIDFVPFHLSMIESPSMTMSKSFGASRASRTIRSCCSFHGCRIFWELSPELEIICGIPMCASGQLHLVVFRASMVKQRCSRRSCGNNKCSCSCQCSILFSRRNT